MGEYTVAAEVMPDSPAMSTLPRHVVILQHRRRNFNRPGTFGLSTGVVDALRPNPVDSGPEMCDKQTCHM
jgi:hypothetical protein